MKGLSSSQADKLLKQYGLNIIEEQKKRPFILKFFDQFNNFLTFLLIAAAVISFAIGESVDAVLILSIIILNALFGLYQEAKAEESIAALKKMTVAKVRVIRDGNQIEIDSRYLVPGDIVYLEEGTKVPADGTVVESVNLEVNEAALTGESMPVIKNKGEELFSGTIVAKGRGYFSVTKTGMRTKFGEIAKNLSIIDRAKTPLQKKLEDLSRQIGIIGIIISLLVFVLSLLRGDGYFPGFMLAVSLAVAVVPEGLPAVMTITLAIGVKEMAKKKSIIRKLSAIEALGSITLIATDKTGTLTTNQMRVKEVYVDDKVYDKKLPTLSNRPFSQIVLNGILCSTASLVYVHDHGRWDILGDPTEGALLFLAQDVGLIPEMVRKEWRLIDEKPFDSVSKMMTVMVTQNSNLKQQKLVFSKGAPESILAICDKILIGHREEKLTEKQKEKIEKQVEQWGKKGLRVLAFSYNHYSGYNSYQNMVFLGLVAIHDAPRPEVAEAVKKTRQAGIKVIMITGDNERTAEAIGVHTGIIKYGDEIITGEQIDQHNDQHLLKILPKIKVFARTNPFQKHRIVKLYQQLGEVVAVTGDGVNDAIALKQADVGVAMGLVGTDVARETADMVITDDNFATIVNAVEEGRNIIRNLKKAIEYLLSCNISEAAAIVFGLIAGISHLFYPIQLLYINLVTDGIPVLAFAFLPRSSRIMKEPPQTEINLLGRRERSYIFIVGTIISLVTLAAYFIYFRYTAEALAKAAVFSVLTFSQQFVLVDLWFGTRTIINHIKQMLIPIFIIAFLFPFFTQFFIVYFPSVSAMFKISSIPLIHFWYFILFSSVSLIIVRGVRRFIKF